LTERIYRENSLNRIEFRQSVEDPKIATVRKMLPRFTFSRGNSVYIIGLYDANGVRKHLKVGFTADMNERLPELQHTTYPQFVVRPLFHMLTDINPLSKK
jgi:hypothetical protein